MESPADQKKPLENLKRFICKRWYKITLASFSNCKYKATCIQFSKFQKEKREISRIAVGDVEYKKDDKTRLDLPLEVSSYCFLSEKLYTEKGNQYVAQSIFNEMVDTEKSYNDLLCLIRANFAEPITTASKQCLVNSTYITALFCHLPELLNLSNILLQGFEKNSYNVEHMCSHIEAIFYIYSEYVQHYKTHISQIEEAKKNLLISKINKEILSRRESRRLGLCDYLIAPFQRIISLIFL
ncbi:Dbl homology domain-containing protein [Sporodiniella umbellata]|nr:Dbl homology domain-containing protein [Sporodiniella umbellata]